MAQWDHIQKQILLGSAATGKSSLLVRLTDDRFLTDSQPTIGVEFGSRIVELANGKRVKLQIWDTAGQESFRSITRSYYRGAGGALLVFDLTNRATFGDCKTWLSDLREWGEPELAILLVGNKGDLCRPDSGGSGEDALRKVTKEEAEAWVQEEGLVGYVETSAKDGKGVQEAFNELTRIVHERSESKLAEAKRKKSSGFSLGGASTAASGKCC